jgi:AraC family transcriptional regulator, regulatory protein of adaptative response / DNA-3-methyladenine glycosylase II
LWSENVQASRFGVGYDAFTEDMELDWQVCSRARLARDARFDGKFFIAVHSTKIYCRPTCPARTCKESSVCYFPTAAAAAEAGFRPCLRCRPECAPGTPAWLGTRNTVSRALRLIDEGGLEDSGIEGLAERLGVGSRHLRRLFLRHLGATPSAVAQTKRLHFAKQLIDASNLPMTQVAVASGFGCVRRFNATIRKVYQRTPTQIRKLARQASVLSENQYLFRLSYRPPYNWTSILAFLAPRAIPGVEAVEAGTYRRSISLHGNAGYFEVSLDEKSDALAVRVLFEDCRSLFFIIERIRAMFDLNADWVVIGRTLRKDAALRERIDANPGPRVPGCWDGFELAIRAILGQQITVKGATTLAGRLVSRFGQRFSAASSLAHLFPTAQVLADADLASVGLTRARAESIRTFSRAVCEGHISFRGIVDSETFLARLSEIPGIGLWTTQYVAMRALREPDAFPSSDRGLLRALDLKSSSELERRAEAWRPWRAYAAMCIWSTAAERGTSRDKQTHSSIQRQNANDIRGRTPEHAF